MASRGAPTPGFPFLCSETSNAAAGPEGPDISAVG